MQLRSTQDDFSNYVSTTAPYLVQGRLEGVRVMVVAVSGVSDKVVQLSVTMLRNAGAAAAGGGVAATAVATHRPEFGDPACDRSWQQRGAGRDGTHCRVDARGASFADS